MSSLYRSPHLNMYLWDEEEWRIADRKYKQQLHNTIITTAKLQALTFLAIPCKVYINFMQFLHSKMMRKIKKNKTFFLMVVVKSANHWHPNRQSLDSTAFLYCMLFLERWWWWGVKQTLHFPAPLIRAKILSITVTRREEVKFESIHSNSTLAFLLSIY